jgi:hypothetical protein
MVEVNPEVKTSPLLFGPEMVLMLKKDKKTQTRRLIKPQPRDGVRKSVFVKSGYEDRHGYEVKCKWEVGQRLWVRETALPDFPKEFSYYELSWREVPEEYRSPKHVIYRADGHWYGINMYPSIHMPRWASRFTLEIIGLWPEEAGQISPEDAIAEGFDSPEAFWEYLAKLYKQEVEEIKELWFWAIEFKKIEFKG